MCSSLPFSDGCYTIYNLKDICLNEEHENKRCNIREIPSLLSANIIPSASSKSPSPFHLGIRKRRCISCFNFVFGTLYKFEPILDFNSHKKIQPLIQHILEYVLTPSTSPHLFPSCSLNLSSSILVSSSFSLLHKIYICRIGYPFETSSIFSLYKR